MKLWLGVVASFGWSSWECCVCSQCMHTFSANVCFYHVLLRGCGICLGRFPNLLCSIFEQFISFLPVLCSENILYMYFIYIYVYERVLQCYYAKTVGIWSFVWTLYILPSIGCWCCIWFCCVIGTYIGSTYSSCKMDDVLFLLVDMWYIYKRIYVRLSKWVSLWGIEETVWCKRWYIYLLWWGVFLIETDRIEGI